MYHSLLHTLKHHKTGRNYVRKAQIIYNKAQRAMDQVVDSELTWEESMTMVENELAKFKGKTKEAKVMRKHIMHCKHEDTCFKQFAFLTMGPLEYGVFYKVESQEGIASSMKNKTRDTIRNEMKKAVEMIVSFPELENWKIKTLMEAFQTVKLQTYQMKMRKRMNKSVTVRELDNVKNRGKRN